VSSTARSTPLNGTTSPLFGGQAPGVRIHRDPGKEALPDRAAVVRLLAGLSQPDERGRTDPAYRGHRSLSPEGRSHVVAGACCAGVVTWRSGRDEFALQDDSGGTWVQVFGARSAGFGRGTMTSSTECPRGWNWKLRASLMPQVTPRRSGRRPSAFWAGRPCRPRGPWTASGIPLEWNPESASWCMA